MSSLYCEVNWDNLWEHPDFEDQVLAGTHAHIEFPYRSVI